MCPICWAVLVAQVVFYAALGLVLVVLTDWKFGLPVSAVTMFLAYGNMQGTSWSVEVWVLYALTATLLSRALWIVFKHEKNWVRRVSLRFGGMIRRTIRPLVYGC